MGKISYAVLDDMERYNKNFDRKIYEGKEESEVVPEFREYYAKRLPVDLLTWIRVNIPKEEMRYHDAFGDQVVFVRDRINGLFYSDYKEFEKNPVMVINTHVSKSIVLPVYQINLKDYGVTMILRDNFHDWKVSIISEKEILVDFMDIFEEDKSIHPIYCEGFQEKQVFGSYCKNKKQFTVEIDNDYNLYLFMYLLNNYLRNRKKDLNENTVKNYIIDTEQGYVKTAVITVVDEVIEVKKATYTKNLQEAMMFTELDYQEDLKAWEAFLKMNEGDGFAFIEAEKKVKIKH